MRFLCRRHDGLAAVLSAGGTGTTGGGEGAPVTVPTGRQHGRPKGGGGHDGRIRNQGPPRRAPHQTQEAGSIKPRYTGDGNIFFFHCLEDILLMGE